jgi:16S rRNA (cytosine1402-N4)-methyltransferase
MLNSILEYPTSHCRAMNADASPGPGGISGQGAAGDYHRPVLLTETLWALAPAPGRLIVDGTLGGGGHAQAILRAGADIIGLDRDGEALAHCALRLRREADAGHARFVHANYRNLGRALDGIGVAQIDGLLLDIGVSSRQIDRAERGFSFRQPGPLDMRMDQSAPLRASDLVNEAEPEELIRIFREYGEEPAARRVADAIVRERRNAPIEDTLALARVVEGVIPKHGPRHPATRVFQALRMAVNDELGALADGLQAAVERLRPGGRLAVITFHSLEDRIVKHFCRDTTNPQIDRPEWPQPRPNPRYAFRALTRRAIQPSETEQRENPRARSAKLRALERIS